MEETAFYFRTNKACGYTKEDGQVRGEKRYQINLGLLNFCFNRGNEKQLNIRNNNIIHKLKHVVRVSFIPPPTLCNLTLGLVVNTEE